MRGAGTGRQASSQADQPREGNGADNRVVIQCGSEFHGRPARFQTVKFVTSVLLFNGVGSFVNRSLSRQFIAPSVYQTTHARHLAVQLYHEHTNRHTIKHKGDLFNLTPNLLAAGWLHIFGNGILQNYVGTCQEKSLL